VQFPDGTTVANDRRMDIETRPDAPWEPRDTFAALALAGLLARGEQRVREPGPQDRLAQEAYELADAMLRVRTLEPGDAGSA
jgi:hypothetical protein